MEGVGDLGMRSASTSSAEADVRCDKERSNIERVANGWAVVIAEAEGPLIFSARPGDSGSSTCGGVLAGDERAFIWEKSLSSSSSQSNCLSAKKKHIPCSTQQRITEERARKRTLDDGRTRKIWVQFRRSEPWSSFARFESEDVNGNVFDPVPFVVEFIGAASPTTPKSLLCGIHGDRKRERGVEPILCRRSTELRL